MYARMVLGVLLIVFLIATAVGIGAYVYNAGVAQGLLQSGRLSELPPGQAPNPYFFGPFFFRPFGFGFGFLGLLFPLFFFFLFFALVRGIFWGGRWGWRRHYWAEGKDVPPPFEEWHRKAHESQAK